MARETEQCPLCGLDYGGNYMGLHIVVQHNIPGEDKYRLPCGELIPFSQKADEYHSAYEHALSCGTCKFLVRASLL